MAMKDGLVNLSGFKGINNVLKPENTPSEYLKKAENVNIDKAGNVLKRSGYSLLNSGHYSALWSNNDKCYAVKEGDLIEINPDYTYTVLKSGIGNIELCFEEVNGLVYFTSQQINGVIENGSITSIPDSRV